MLVGLLLRLSHVGLSDRRADAAAAAPSARANERGTVDGDPS
jgi:hypothetical protein